MSGNKFVPDSALSLEGVDEPKSMANALAPSSLAGDGSSGVFARAT